jgi:cytochrome P450
VPDPETGPNNVSINDQASVEPIYASASAWEKSQAYKLGREPDHGLFFLRGKDAHHVRRRQYWAPAFSGQALASYIPMIERCTDHLLDMVLQRSKAAGGQVDISRALQQWSHNVTVSQVTSHLLTQS